ncbi:MAG: ABC transporter permease [Clostridiales bacterium]|nr:ABC transporter permease [Clostridiales bacterium]
MEKTLVIAKRELRKVIGNWRKTLTVFLLPAVLMMLALNIFPFLVNYMTTGSFGQKPIVVLDAPRSFVRYTENEGASASFSYDFVDTDEYEVSLRKEIRHGNIVLVFDGEKSVRVVYNESSYSLYSRAGQLITSVLKGYSDSLENIDGRVFDIDAFNPVTDIMMYRSTANAGAARVIPGVLVLLMYYCVYALSSDSFAAERARGFLGKLMMTPVKPSGIMLGKTLAITVIVWISSLVTFFVLFLSSWLNHSNDAMSLLPFGLLLSPGDLLTVIITVPATVFVMVMLAVNMIFSLEKLSDIILNLQLPLILLLVEFFIQMARSVKPLAPEYIIPVHNTICVMRNAFASESDIRSILISIVINILTGYLLFRANRKIFSATPAPSAVSARKRKRSRRNNGGKQSYV